jgi:hypothetical protein
MQKGDEHAASTVRVHTRVSTQASLEDFDAALASAKKVCVDTLRLRFLLCTP